jgi:hypothetical protein
MPSREEILLKSTKAYERLINQEYLITVGKNKTLKPYKLCFTPNEYKHLFGFQKLKDRDEYFNTASKFVFDDVINGKMDCTTIVSSRFYEKIEKRVENIFDLEQYIDSFNEIYDWDKSKARSDIVGDIMIPNKSIRNDKDKIYVFFNDIGADNTELKIGDIIIGEFNIKIEIPVSFIVEPNKDYAVSLVRPSKVLYKDKLDKAIQSKTILLDKLTK